MSMQPKIPYRDMRQLISKLEATLQDVARIASATQLTEFEVAPSISDCEFMAVYASGITALLSSMIAARAHALPVGMQT